MAQRVTRLFKTICNVYLFILISIIYLYSASSDISTFKKELFAYSKNSFDHVDIFDKDPQKIGTELFGKTILDPEKLVERDYGRILIMVGEFEQEVKAYLIKKGFKKSQFLTYFEFEKSTHSQLFF